MVNVSMSIQFCVKIYYVTSNVSLIVKESKKGTASRSKNSLQILGFKGKVLGYCSSKRRVSLQSRLKSKTKVPTTRAVDIVDRSAPHWMWISHPGPVRHFDECTALFGPNGGGVLVTSEEGEPNADILRLVDKSTGTEGREHITDKLR
ncbi:hypothetical protein WA026_008085 [Henosepilachna vigintioctopunctata]|uniref:Uncharacterized protein n=1 Tax=Henosepilachna vigintioctopunctata TaxID=420089 RepID=A0AAW1TPD6_9CUCU